MNRNGIIAVVDDKGREKERYQVVYGAKLQRRRRGRRSRKEQILLEWDPYTFSILTEQVRRLPLQGPPGGRHAAGAG